MQNIAKHNRQKGSIKADEQPVGNLGWLHTDNLSPFHASTHNVSFVGILQTAYEVRWQG